MAGLTTLTLRSLTEADATPTYAAWFADPSTRRWIAHPTPTVEECRAYIRAHQRPHEMLWAIVVDGRHVGNLKVERSEDRTEATLGLLIAPAERRQGYGSLAIGEAIAWCFKAWEVRRVRAGVHPFNTRSLRLFERCGFRPADDPPQVWLQMERP